MADQYTIIDFRQRDNPDNNGNAVYYVDATGPNGLVENAYYATKNKPPVVGEVREWEYSDGEYGPRFKNPSMQQGSGGGGSHGGSQGRSGGGKTPETDRRIVRQHAQKVAATFINPAENLAGFQDICDTLCQDVDEYAKQGAPAATQPQLPDIDTLKKQFQQGLTNVGVSLSDGVAAIGAMYQRDKLQAGDNVPALIAKAKELADEPVPF